MSQQSLHPHNNLLSLRFLFLVLSLLVHNVCAIGVRFTTPAAGATWPGGQNITVEWEDAGGSPDMAQLTGYMLNLVVGGNDPSNSDVVFALGAAEGQIADGQVEDYIPADIAQSIENGFYFRMESNTTDGNQVINYSNRFTLIRMNGTTEAQYLDGANSARGSSDVPPAQYNVLPQTSQSASASAPASTTLTATATATPTGAPSENSGSDISDPILPTSAKIGIGIGVLLALIGIASLFIWAYMLYRHRKRRRQSPPETTTDRSARTSRCAKSPFVDGKAELSAHSAAASSQSTIARSTELSPISISYEMDGGGGKPTEAARASIYELEGDWSGWEAGTGRKSRIKSYDPTAM